MEITSREYQATVDFIESLDYWPSGAIFRNFQDFQSPKCPVSYSLLFLVWGLRYPTRDFVELFRNEADNLPGCSINALLESVDKIKITLPTLRPRKRVESELQGVENQQQEREELFKQYCERLTQLNIPSKADFDLVDEKIRISLVEGRQSAGLTLKTLSVYQEEFCWFYSIEYLEKVESGKETCHIVAFPRFCEIYRLDPWAELAKALDHLDPTSW